MTEHPRVLVGAARLQSGAVEERREVQRRRFGAGHGLVNSREMDRIARELIEDQDQMSELEALSR